jgi:hypothetical protein
MDSLSDIEDLDTRLPLDNQIDALLRSSRPAPIFESDDPSLSSVQRYYRVFMHVVIVPFCQGMFYGVGELLGKVLFGSFWNRKQRRLIQKSN